MARPPAGSTLREGDVVIGVLGANGRLGGLVAQELAARGVPATALVRRPRSGLALAARHADLRDRTSLDAALSGVHRLLLVTPHGPDQDLLELAAIHAAARAGVERIVKISGTPTSLGPNGPTSTAVAHWRSERLVEEAGFDFAFLRPSFFMQNLTERFAARAGLLGVLASPLGRAPIAMVDARDVAACATHALLAEEAGRRPWHLTGPEAVTIRDVARRLALRHVAVPGRVASRALARQGASAFEIEHAERMTRFFAAGSDGTVTDHVTRLTARPARRLTDFLDEHAAAFAPTTALARVLTHPTGG
ncbi:MAG: NAD(P)H-binding protein [Solirubrobacteraceae bacterium]|nr:NAD(P)H-binding protein [Solirubrobacteraceae bacterium]